MGMPPECMYQPMQTEEELEAWLARIGDPKKRAEEEKRLREL